MTEYISNITIPNNNKIIGGNTFDGQWVWQTINILASGTSLTANASKTIDLSSILPDANYDYEIVLEGLVSTGSTSGNQARLQATASGGYRRELGYCVTRASSTQMAGNIATIVIKANNHTLELKNTAGATGTFGCWIKGYRRIGTNGTENDYISNISIHNSTKVPNVLIEGNPTNTNGIISNFSEDNYLDVLNGKKDDNAEYVIKFTTVSVTKATVQTIYCAEYFFTLEIKANTWDVITYNWETGADTTLFTASANTTYWVKISVNGKTKTFSYSTDGENYTQVANFTDNDMDATDSYLLRIGNHSANALLYQRAFLGSVDLNETYININGERFWDGMDYIKRLAVGGTQFDGQWQSGATLQTGISLASNANKSIDISSYIPNDGYSYAAIFKVQGNTGTASGNNIQLRLGHFTTNNSNPRCAAIVTRTSNYMSIAGLAYILIPNNTRTIYLSNTGNATGTDLRVYLRGFKRLGSNDESINSYIETIATGNNITKFGGYISGDEWIYKHLDVFGTSWHDSTSGTVHNYTVNNYLPTNNEWYEILCWTAGATNSTSGNSLNIDVKCEPSLIDSTPFGLIKTRTSSTNVTSQNPILIGRQNSSGNMTVRIYNYSTTNASTGNCYLRFSAYRKLGTNS